MLVEQAQVEIQFKEQKPRVNEVDAARAAFQTLNMSFFDEWVCPKTGTLLTDEISDTFGPLFDEIYHLMASYMQDGLPVVDSTVSTVEVAPVTEVGPVVGELLFVDTVPAGVFNTPQPIVQEPTVTLFDSSIAVLQTPRKEKKHSYGEPWSGKKKDDRKKRPRGLHSYSTRNQVVGKYTGNLYDAARLQKAVNTRK